MNGHCKSWLFIAVFTFAIVPVILLLSSPARAAGPWYVAPHGDDNHSCLTTLSPCATINGAIAKASPGDTIYVAIGAYTANTGDEVVLVDRSITISGGWDSDFNAQIGMSTIDGQGLRRGLAVTGNVDVELSYFLIQAGHSGDYLLGGGIFNDGHVLVLNNLTIMNNTGSSGGGIFSWGTLTLNDSTVTGNQAGRGGGILNDDLGFMTLNNSTISNNVAIAFGGGGIANDGTLILNNSAVNDNTSLNEGGGGIFNGSGDSAIITVNNSIVSGNSTTISGGGIANAGTLTVDNSVISHNTAEYMGGGISTYRMTINASEVISNTASEGGGGIYGSGNLTVTNSAISNNSTGNLGGGGILSDGILTLTNSTLDNNSTAEHGRGGGISQNDGTLTLNNSTVSNNSAWYGGGIYTANTVVSGMNYLNNSTISNNIATADSNDPYGGGGIFNNDYYSSYIISQNSIIAGNFNSNSPDCSGTIISGGYNVIGNSLDCTFAPSSGDWINVNAQLLPLTGSPGYHPLKFGSPAINGGNPAGCTDHEGSPLDMDQRGVARIGRCDIGSYEYDGPVNYIFMPLVAKPKPPRGLYGIVQENGTPAASIPLSLRYYNGSTWSTIATKTTAADGSYSFTGMPALSPGQRYSVLYQNTASGNPNRLWAWVTQAVSAYAPGSEFNIGNFDLANVALVSPDPGTTVSLPTTFRWTPRPASPTDSYEFNLFDYEDGDPYFYTDPPLGYVSAFTLHSLPPGFAPDVYYTWNIWVYSPDGGYGISYWSYYVRFTTTSMISAETEPAVFLRQNPPREDWPVK
jgi:predicted outer membrane repeat protein